MMDKNISLNNELKMLINEKKYEEAERILEFIRYIDKNSIVLNILGLLNYRRGFYKRSQEYFIESYRLDSNKDAHYYLDVLFENNNAFKEYYSALQLCRDKRYDDAEIILKKTINIKQSRIIYFTIKYLRGSLYERIKILREFKSFISGGRQSVKIYESMKMNYRNSIRPMFLYFLFIIVAFIVAALLSV